MGWSVNLRTFKLIKIEIALINSFSWIKGAEKDKQYSCELTDSAYHKS